MILSNISKNISLPKICRIGTVLISQRHHILRKCHSFHKRNLITSAAWSVQVNQGRCYSTESEEKHQSPTILHPLLKDDILIVPNVFKTFQNIYHLKAHVHKVDPSFSVPDFVDASKQAVAVVSNLLGKENYEALEGLLTNDLIQRLRQKIMTLTPSEKELIPIDAEDIYGHFPYTIKMIYEGEGDSMRSYLDICMVFYSLKGLKDYRARGIEPPLQMGLMPEYRDKIFVSNYLFRKDYTDGTEAPWIVHLCNHVMLLAYN